MSNKEVVIQVKDMRVEFDLGRGNVLRAVKDVSFDVYKGETLGIVGESGSGKTTIIRAMLGINDLAGGEVMFKGKNICGKLSRKEKKAVKKDIQMIFQDPAASLNERATVDYIISEGLYNFGLYDSEEERLQKVAKALDSVGLLKEHMSRYPHEFSGGQRQRIGIARALVIEPEVILADEPISALDASIRAQVLNLMKDLQNQAGYTYIFIAHDLSVVRYIADRIAVIHKGNIVELAETEALFANPIHPYTRSLLSAIPVPDPEIERNKVHIHYDGSEHDYSEQGPSLREIAPGHFVFCNDAEEADYKKRYKQQ
jgi:oligopeptide transport system ATP-binding protein